MIQIPSNRFDLMAKYLYIKSKDKEYATDFFKTLYHKHLITFNNCWEYPGTKTNIKQFFTHFDSLINNMKSAGFNKEYPITINNKGILVNGAHRLMTSYYYNIQPHILTIQEDSSPYDYRFFLYRNQWPPLEQINADRMALEYIQVQKNIRSMIIYPVAAYDSEKLRILEQIVSQYGYIYYKKQINLNQQGVNNLIKELYREEEWIGGLFPRGYSPGGKAQRCVANKPTILLLIDMKDLSKLVELKNKCRNLFNLGKHSLHISDETKDTFRIGSSLLNKHSIHFLNHGSNDITEHTKYLLAKYFKHVDTTREDYCLTSSLILEMYHLRQAKDIDYLHTTNNNIRIEEIGVHDGIWETYYGIHKDEIIYNPNNHFYFNGFKFATLDIIKKMKQNRNEVKDQHDITLIQSIN